MTAAGDLDLLTRACDALLPVVDEYEGRYLGILAETGRTNAVNGLRAARLQRAIIAVGMFSLFEAALKSEYNWPNPISRLEEVLKATDPALWNRFETYWLANNVLKHGTGKSLEKLVQRRAQLEFEVRAEDEAFFEEGVINEIHSRIDITNPFVRNCAALIEQISLLIAKESRDA